jgi:hypothetical protein
MKVNPSDRMPRPTSGLGEAAPTIRILSAPPNFSWIAWKSFFRRPSTPSASVRLATPDIGLISSLASRFSSMAATIRLYILS